MTVPNTTRDDLLNLVTRLEAQINEKLESVDDLKKRHTEAKKAVEGTKVAIETLRNQLRVEEEAAQGALYDYNITVSDLKRLKGDLDIARRRLDRLYDAEQIQKQLHDQMLKFRNACLDAAWRAENRSDGRGAFEYQIDGAIQMAVARQGLLGDKRGLGKTLTSLVWCDILEAKKVIMICPSDTMDNFIREIALWTPHRQPIKIGKMPRAQRDFILMSIRYLEQFMLVVNFEAWRRDEQLIQDIIALQLDTMIVDESHVIKETSTNAYKGVKAIRFGVNSCKCGVPSVVVKENRGVCWCGNEGDITEFCSIQNVLLMTGTPILNKPQELYAQLSIIDPKNFNSLSNYQRDFCRMLAPGKWTWQYGAEEQVVKTIGPRLLVRNREAVGITMAPPEPIAHKLDLDEMKEKYPKQYEAYIQARDYAQLVLDPDNNIVERMIKITALLRMRQILSWPGEIEPKVFNPETGNIETLGKLNVFESIKLDKVESLIREINEEGDRAVLFSQFKDPLVELQRRLGSRTAVYAGGTSTLLRNQIALDFDAKVTTTNYKWDNVLCIYKSGGVGLNMTGANHLIILDKEWNPGKEDQAIGRIDRLGQLKDVFVHDIEVVPSIDSWMAELIQTKFDLVNGFEGEVDFFRQAYEAMKEGKI
jgi:SNF2 family DNA or RNA helicase